MSPLGRRTAVAAAVVLLAGCGSPGAPAPAPETLPSPSLTLAPATREPVPATLRPILDRLWVQQRHGCAEPSSIVVDRLAAALVDELAVPALDARIVAGQYRNRVRCPGR